MSHHDASEAQYGPTPGPPTPVPTIGTPPPRGGHGLPHTGYDVGTPLAIGALAIALGYALRNLARRP